MSSLVWAILLFLFVVNFLSLVFFGWDKLWATRGGRRVPEVRLLTLAFVGPFGAFLGMVAFRHKTRKPRFLLVPLFLTIQVLLLYYLGVFSVI